MSLPIDLGILIILNESVNPRNYTGLLLLVGEIWSLSLLSYIDVPTGDALQKFGTIRELQIR